jgi:hypothetical protein
MGHDGTSDGNVWEFPITDAVCLQIINGEELAIRLAKVLGPARKQIEGDPICVIDVEEGATYGVTVDFDNFGPGCRLSCGPATSALELLPWVNLLLPSAQIVSMHASAFTWKGEGVVVTGNAGSGKTGALLAAIHHGAGAVGDECLWLDRNARLRGLLVEMEIRAGYFRELPHLRTEVSTTGRYGIFICDILGRGIRPFLPKLSRKFAGRARAHVQPDIVRRHLAPSATIDRLFVSRVHPGNRFRVYPVELAEVVPELVDIQSQEFARQRELYTRYRDNTGGRQNEWMEGLTLRLEKLFGEALRNTKSYIVEHPPSPRAHDLFHTIAATWL